MVVSKSLACETSHMVLAMDQTVPEVERLVEQTLLKVSCLYLHKMNSFQKVILFCRGCSPCQSPQSGTGRTKS